MFNLDCAAKFYVSVKCCSKALTKEFIYILLLKLVGMSLREEPCLWKKLRVLIFWGRQLVLVL